MSNSNSKSIVFQQPGAQKNGTKMMQLLPIRAKNDKLNLAKPDLMRFK